MKDLYEAIGIFLKYGNPTHPTHCEHDELWICGIEPDDVSKDDMEKLDELGFFVDEYDNSFKSYKFGSA